MYFLSWNLSFLPSSVLTRFCWDVLLGSRLKSNRWIKSRENEDNLDEKINRYITFPFFKLQTYYDIYDSN